LQNLADGLKLFRKQVFSPREADPLGYYLAPTAYLITSIVLLGFLPVSAGFVAGAVPLSLLLALAIFSFAPLFIFVGSWSSNNKYSLIGGMRTAAQMVAYEIPLLLSVVSVVILSGSFDLGTIVQDQARDGWYGAPLILGLIVFSVAILAEIERIPFDLPEAEAELVEGWNTEYGGILFAMTMMTDYIRSLVGSYLVVLLFLGGWTLPTWGGLGILSSFPLSGILWFQVKTYIVFGVFVWVRAALPRVRTDQLLQIGWRRMLPLSLLNIAIAAGWVLAGWPHLTWPSV
jgi:NADH-quinone oxidoreductase subunit H